jgi:hypothetical protein
MLVLALAVTGCRRRPRAPVAPETQYATSITVPSAGGEAPSTPSANEECGTDRRCRLSRLRRLGRARNASRAAALEAHHEAVGQAVERVEHDRIPRRRHPWLIENVISDHQFGAIVGLHPMPHLFVGVGAGMVFSFGHSEWHDGGSSFVSTSPLFAVDLEARWLVFDHNITPYLSGGFHVMLGSITASGSSDGGITFVNSNASLEVHALSVGLGLDVHTDFGLRFSAGALLRPLIYVRARELEEPVQMAEDGFHKGWRLFGAQGTLGWSW